MHLLISRLEEHQCRPREGFGGQWTARCPSHADRLPSLSFRLSDGKPILYCHAGCSTEDVLASLGLSFRDLGGAEALKVIEEYIYEDERGIPQFSILRFAPKTFRYKRIAGAPRACLFGLPELRRACEAGGTVYVCEGEKDCLRLRQRLSGATEWATCNPGGAGKWRKEYSEQLKGAGKVIIWRDRDAPGAKHASLVRSHLQGICPNVRIVESRAGKDAWDHLEAGFSPQEATIVESDGLSLLDVAGMLSSPPNPIEWLLEGWLARGELCVFGGEPKSGKSLLLLGAALSLAMGESWLGSVDVPSPGLRTLYIDEENTERELHRRLYRIGRGMQLSPSDLVGKTEVQYSLRKGINLDDEAGQDTLRFLVDQAKPDLIVFDSLIRMHRRDENSNAAMSEFYSEKLQPLTSNGTSVVLIHHLSKPPQTGTRSVAHRLRGASDISAMADHVWGLERTESGRRLVHALSRGAEPQDPLDIVFTHCANGGLSIVGRLPPQS